MLVASGASHIGPSHEQDDLPNQDAFRVSQSGKGLCVAVADGLGSRPLSQIGSKTAVGLVRDLSQSAKELHHSKIAPWLSQAWKSAFNDQFDAYETTCLWAWVDRYGNGVAGQIGDGLLLIRSEGCFKVLTPESTNFGNQTQTLSCESAEPVSTNICITMPGDGVLLVTDGIADDLVPDQLEYFFDAVYQKQRRLNKRQMKRWLKSEMEQWSTPLHGDDKTIAGIFRVE